MIRLELALALAAALAAVPPALGATDAPPVSSTEEPIATGHTAPPSPSTGGNPVRLRPVKAFLDDAQLESLGVRKHGEDGGSILACRLIVDDRLWIALFRGQAPRYEISLLGTEPLQELSTKRLSESGDGWLSAEFATGGTPIKFSIRDEPNFFLLHHSLIERSGTIDIDGETVRFLLRGRGGHYDRPGDELVVDIDRDGVAERHHLSHERFPVDDPYLNIAGKSYRFEVDSSGNAIRLFETDRSIASKVVLEPGHTIPDFVAIDYEGNELRPSDFRGKLLLVYSWGSWCGPCNKEMPLLRDLYRDVRASGVEFVGLNRGDGLEAAIAYPKEHELPWPHVLEGSNGGALELLRMDHTPATLLVGRDGNIIQSDLRGDLLRAAIVNEIDGMREQD